MVATPKFTGLEKAWNNLYVGYIKGIASTLVLQLYSRTSKGLSVGVLLMAVNCKIYAANSCVNT